MDETNEAPSAPVEDVYEAAQLIAGAAGFRSPEGRPLKPEALRGALALAGLERATRAQVDDALRRWFALPVRAN